MSRIDLPGYGIETTPSSTPEPSCVICRADGVDIDDWGHCPECRPREEETCEAWDARVAPRRAK